MGTSKSYDLPTGTNWSNTKNKFTRASKKISDSSGTPRIPPLVNSFVNSSGGSKSYSRTGNGFGNSKAVISAGHKLGSFISEISKEGIENTFSKYFGDRLSGKSMTEVCLELTDFFCDEASFTNNTDAKSAMYELLEELLEEADDESDVAEIFDTQATNEDLSQLIERYFGLYIVEQIKRSFYGRLEKKHGQEAAKKLINEQIKTYAIERTREESKTHNLIDLDFSKPSSYKFVEEILQEVISIFE